MSRDLGILCTAGGAKIAYLQPMDVVAARAALEAWRSQPQAVRREVVDLARRDLPAPDPALARLAVDWGRGEVPLTYRTLLVVGPLGIAILGSHQYGRANPGIDLADVISVVCLAALLGCAIAVGSRHRGSRVTAAVNLRALVAAGHYHARESLDIRGTRPPRWLIPAGMTMVVLCVGALVAGSLPWSGRPWTEVIGTLFPGLLLPGLFALSWYYQPSQTLKRRPRAGERVLALGPDGLELAELGRTVAWSDVAAVRPVSASLVRGHPLAISLVLREPKLTVFLPVHWLDEDPGVLLATVRHLAAAPETTAA
jgi:hypothetical protein